MSLSSTVAAIRHFNRFYTRLIGALDEAHLGAPYGLTEGRILFEVAQAPDGITPTEVIERTGLDSGYLSRIVNRFEREGVMMRARSPSDRRSVSIGLTDQGATLYRDLRQVVEGAVEGLVSPLSAPARRQLTRAMQDIEGLLGATPPGEITLRPHRVGDMGWVIERHGVLYGREYGWDERFEALVARICADFVEAFDPLLERCWIAERDGVRLGSIFLVKGDHAAQAQLRLLLVEPHARGCGLGARLIAECADFARAAGYREITLWTQSVLIQARKAYAAAGFKLVDSSPHRRIGVELVGEKWTLQLEPRGGAERGST
jgi:DNA-binding MarR family transcriptional regulator/N-acetylglutamate synthase-like GNAT family acetyltransferase